MVTTRPTRLGQAIRTALCFSLAPFSLLTSQSVLAEEVVQKDSQAVETIVVTASALKVDTPAQETPKSVSVVTEQDLVNRAPQKLDEALRYTSGVASQPYGADNDTDWIKVRGFDAATYLDGSRLFKNSYYTWLLEPYGLEKVEVLKGPASILYGEAPPGGVVNAVQKKPTDAPQGDVGVQVGSNSLRTLSLDISDYANEDGSVRYRLVGLMKENDGELNGTESRRFYLAPSLAIDISERTHFTLLTSYLEDSGIPTNPFFPAAGTLTDSNFGSIDPSTNLGQPDYDKYERKQISAGYLLEHELNDVLSLTQKFNYGYNELYLRSSYSFMNADPSTDTLSQGLVFREGKTESFSLDNNAIAKWESSRIANTVLLGLELQHHKTDGVEADNYGFGSINPFNPVYGNYTAIDESSAADRDITKQQASLYGQYQIKIDSQWIASIGGRFDWVKTDNESVSNSQRESRNDTEFSLDAGVMYISSVGLSPYVSYSQSFDVLSTIDSATGDLYKPLKGDQAEVGIKYEPSFYNGYINLALFDMTQKNALVTNPTTYVATQTGEVTSHGVEIETTGYLTDSLKLTASYTYTKAETDETSGKGTKQAALIPEHMASAWLDFDANKVGLEGWKFGSGIRYIGESKDNPKSSDLTVPSVTLVDMMASYDITKAWQAQLNVNNLFDKEYISGCDYWCYYGQSRSVVLSANYRW
ncbi:TonB-dependent siderophore receptor [Vibrio sp. C8]